MIFGVGTCIICRPGPASPQRHDPDSRAGHALTCTPFPEEPTNDDCVKQPYAAAETRPTHRPARPTLTVVPQEPAVVLRAREAAIAVRMVRDGWITKFLDGAWIVVVAIPVLFVLMRGVHRHYQTVYRT